MAGIYFCKHNISAHSPVKSSYAKISQVVGCQASQLALYSAWRAFLCGVIDLVEPSQRDVIDGMALSEVASLKRKVGK
jgi:hypothetical protein